MAVAPMPKALVERLGTEGAEGLVNMLASARAEWTDDVMTMAVDRFERRVATEISTLRVDVTREVSALRVDFTRELSALRGDFTSGVATLREDFTRELSGGRVELLKWSFLFWVGQVAAMAGLLAFMLRA